MDKTEKRRLKRHEKQAKNKVKRALEREHKETLAAKPPQEKKKGKLQREAEALSKLAKTKNKPESTIVLSPSEKASIYEDVAINYGLSAVQKNRLLQLAETARSAASF